MHGTTDLYRWRSCRRWGARTPAWPQAQPTGDLIDQGRSRKGQLILDKVGISASLVVDKADHAASLLVKTAIGKQRRDGLSQSVRGEPRLFHAEQSRTPNKAARRTKPHAEQTR